MFVSERDKHKVVLSEAVRVVDDVKAVEASCRRLEGLDVSTSSASYFRASLCFNTSGSASGYRGAMRVSVSTTTCATR